MFMLGPILGVLVILLGAKAFTKKGIPLTRQKHLTGSLARIIGVACILLGLAFIAEGMWATFHMASLLRDGR